MGSGHPAGDTETGRAVGREWFMAVPNYRLTEKLGAGPYSSVFKGWREDAPQRPLVIKILKPEVGSRSRTRYFRQKIEHLKTLNDERLIPPSDLIEYRGFQIIVRDYFNGLTLDQWEKTQPGVSLESFFDLACKLADALEVAHKMGVIHGGIKPHNILVQPVTGEVRLVDFITPMDVRNVSHFIYERAFVEGTLAYTSPEQTGRISHRVAFTSDLYSLGIVLYELLTGRLPFFSTDPLELIHSHLAEEAPPAHELNPEVPPMVSKLLARLLVKEPEKRYQSGAGLHADLVRCKEEYEAHGAIGEFALGTHDRTRRVMFVSKMVGRDTEARTILGEYEQVANGAFRSLLISGYSGVGKTRLIQELQRPIVKSHGYFTSGKFDVYQKNIPYSSMIQAFRTLIRTILTESNERVAGWKTRIQEAVGSRGRVITEIVPELETLIGPQPEVSALPPIEARNRFHDVFGAFLGCLASAESPLVLFIDDLQWCDTATLDFLANVFADAREHPYLFLLGAYRDNEVDESHPLAKLIRCVRAGGQPLTEIRLGALQAEHTHEMVSYILDSPPRATQSLAHFIFGLTEGNPLFVSESLSYLYNENLLSLDEDTREWHWNMAMIRQSRMPSSVVTLFSSKVRRLPPETVDLLEYCACMGNLFSAEDLSEARQLSVVEVFKGLNPALSHWLIVESREQLQFVHDKVQEAVLSAIPGERRRRIHARLGRYFLSRVPPGTDLQEVDNLFMIASHANLGREAVLTDEEAYALSHLNYCAGSKALASLATEAANDYFHKSLEALPEDCWEVQYERTFKILQKLAKTELMVGRSEQSESLLNQLLEHARSELDKAEALAEQTTSLSSMGNFVKAIETANRGLAFFGKSLPEGAEPAERKRDAILAEIDTRYSDVWSTILHMPFTKDRKSKVELAFYAELIPDLYMSGLVPQLYLSAAQSTRHCLAGGMDESVIYSFSIMGLFLGEQERFAEAFKYEDLAKNLSERHPNTFGATRGINGVVWCNMHSRSRPEEIVKYCQKGIQSGKSCGDLYNAGLCYGPLMWNLQVRGANLLEIEGYARECLQFSQKFQLSFSVGLAESMEAGWIKPFKKDYRPQPMREKLAQWRAANHIACIGAYYVLLGLTSYYFGEHEAAEENLQCATRYMHGLTDNVLKRQWYVFRALNAIRLHEQGLAYQSHGELMAYVRPLLGKVERWAGLGPLLGPYLMLLRAELQRGSGEFRETRGAYLDAIDAARREGYTFLEGHMNERLGTLLQQAAAPTADVYFWNAMRLYRACHAERAEASLAERFPAFVEEARAAPGEAEAPPTLPSLDVDYLMKSARAISAEIDTEPLQKKILDVVLESSGAQHGYLLLAEGGELRVRAESHVGESLPRGALPRRLGESPEICASIVRYVSRTKKPLMLEAASERGPFANDPETQALKLRSVLCLPLVKKARLRGVLYLENRLSDAVFTEARAEMTRLLAAQAVISLENAELVERMRRAEEQISSALREKDALLGEIQQLLVSEQLARAEAQEANREKDVFLAKLSHELRTPLTPILAWSQVLGQGKLGPEKIAKAAQVIERSARAQRQLVDDLLDVSRIVLDKLALDLQDTCIPDILEGAIDAVRPSAEEKSLRLVEELASEVPPVRGDAGRLRQVFANLLTNAVKFTPAGGEVSVRLRAGSMPAEPGREAVVVEVSDTGQGIAPEFLPHVFERFSQGDDAVARSRRGLGLGLSIVRSLVLLHGGVVQAESPGPGRGATFRVVLPTAAPSPR